MSAIFKIEEIIELLKKHNNFVKESGVLPEAINGIHTDSRNIKQGYLFCCIKGLAADGHDYYEQARNNGASLFICEKSLPIDFPQILVKNSRKATDLIAKAFYHIDDVHMKLVGITGTNGKTTTAYLAWQLAEKSGIHAAYIGTIGCYFGEQIIETSLTTPDTIELMKLLNLLHKNNIAVVFIEVSSHALVMERLNSLKFSCAAFLNLTQDHLDFHKDMQDYAEAKFRLFNLLHDSGTAIINTSSIHGKKLWNINQNTKLSFGCNDSDILINNIDLDISKSNFTLTINDEQAKIYSPLSGTFNIENLSIAIALVKAINIDISLEDLCKHAQTVNPVPGRLEKVDNKLNIPVYIDYAHTPDAISKACAAIKPFVSERLITIIGAGGNRDKEKRPGMLKAALKDSNLVIVTSDNPRFETPLEIIKDIMNNAPSKAPVWIKENRKEAIIDALNIAKYGDSILITGKGHEQYQDICGVKHSFDEKRIVKESAIEINNKHPQIHFDRIMLEYSATGRIQTTSNQRIKTISTDSRTIKPDSLFIPISGENFNGHNYIQCILSDTSCITLSSEVYNTKNERIIYVDDTLKAFGNIARSYRLLLGTKLFGITGSTGKTTVKEYLSSILEKTNKTAKTSANENNFIGVSKTLLSLKPDDIYGVIELGTNHFGEIDWLTSITLPQVSVIINIGASHLEYLVNLEGVFKEKSSIFKHGAEKCFFPGDDKLFQKSNGISFGNKPSNTYHFKNFDKEGNLYSMNINGVNYKFNVKAEFQVYNAAIAASIALEEGIDSKIIQRCLLNLPEIDKRLQVIRVSNTTIISDCYNANPESMISAIEYWKDIEPEKPHVAFLGSMLELGKNSQYFHEEIGKRIKKYNPEKLITIGSEAIYYNSEDTFSCIEDLLMERDNLNLPNNAVILVKGSHGVQLEKLVDILPELIAKRRNI